VLNEIIQYKCSTIFEEAQDMASDIKILDRYKDLFIEQSKILLSFYLNNRYVPMQLDEIIYLGICLFITSV